jgi:hypothetical protein
VAEEIGATLRELTGQNFDPYAEVWSKWWAEHKAEFESTTDVKTGKPREPFPDIKYYGVPIKSDRVVFIIDISGSMNEETKKVAPPPAPKPGSVTPGENPTPPPPEPDVVISGKKVDVAKDELRKAIKKLPKTARFNIIAFNTVITPWQKTMMDASDATKEDAIKWVMDLKAVGGTFTDGALRLAFQMAGIGAVDKAYEASVDTIILMSDGEPTDNTWPDTKLMEPKVILDHVKEWNPQRKIVVNTIAMDIKTDDGRAFLKDLAHQNGGTFVGK